MFSYNSYPKLALAGKANLTLKNPATGKHIRVKFIQKKDRKTGKLGSCYYLYISVLGDGKAGYVYAGAYFSDSGKFKFGQPTTEDNSKLHAIASYVVNAIRNPLPLHNHMIEINHAGKCCRCGRKLTHPESIKTGIGPECSKHF